MLNWKLLNKAIKLKIKSFALLNRHSTYISGFGNRTVSSMEEEVDNHARVRQLQHSVLIAGVRGKRFGKPDINIPGLAHFFHRCANFIMVLCTMATCGNEFSNTWSEDRDHALVIGILAELSISLSIWYTRKPYRPVENEWLICAFVEHHPKTSKYKEHFYVRYFRARIVLDVDEICMDKNDRQLLQYERLFIENNTDSAVYIKHYVAIQNKLVQLDNTNNNPHKEPTEIITVSAEANYVDWIRFSLFGVNLASKFVDLGVLHGKQMWKVSFSNFCFTKTGVVEDKRTPSVVQTMLQSFIAVPNTIEGGIDTFDKNNVPEAGDQLKIVNPTIPAPVENQATKINQCFWSLLEERDIDESAIGLVVSVEPHGLNDYYTVQSYDSTTNMHTLCPCDSAKQTKVAKIDGETVKFYFQNLVSDQQITIFRNFPEGSHVTLKYDRPEYKYEKNGTEVKVPAETIKLSLVFSQSGIGVHSPLLLPFHVLAFLYGKGQFRFNNSWFLHEPIEEAPDALFQDGKLKPSVDDNDFFDTLVRKRGMAAQLRNVVYDTEESWPHYRILKSESRRINNPTPFESRILGLEKEIIDLIVEEPDTEETATSQKKLISGQAYLWTHLPKLPSCVEYVAREAAKLINGGAPSQILDTQQMYLRQRIKEVTTRRAAKNEKKVKKPKSSS